jgi:hypothetical protein
MKPHTIWVSWSGCEFTPSLLTTIPGNTRTGEISPSAPCGRRTSKGSLPRTFAGPPGNPGASGGSPPWGRHAGCRDCQNAGRRYRKSGAFVSSAKQTAQLGGIPCAVRRNLRSWVTPRFFCDCARSCQAWVDVTSALSSATQTPPGVADRHTNVARLDGGSPDDPAPGESCGRSCRAAPGRATTWGSATSFRGNCPRPLLPVLTSPCPQTTPSPSGPWRRWPGVCRRG